MSIYCSRVTVGWDFWDSKQRGHVVEYPHNQLALVDKPDWQQGDIHTSHIPSWCVPGYGPDETGLPDTAASDFEHISEWLRLSISVGGTYLSVLVDEKAVRLLVKDLRRWLKEPKLANRYDEPEPP